MIDLDISKLFIILGFLGALILVQLIVKRSTIFSKLFTGPSPTLLKVINKVSVSNYSTASVLQYEDRSLLIVSGKNTQPTVVEVSPTTAPAVSGRTNDT